MSHLNVEFKARSEHTQVILTALARHQAHYYGKDHQIDTYFNVPHGRLKLREGTIENSLIYYNRKNQAGPKPSQVILYETTPQTALKELLTKALGVKVIVDKQREIYFVNTVKIHLDTVLDLGTFIEVEAIDKEGTIGKETLQHQCTYYQKKFGITDDQLEPLSYSDLLLTQNEQLNYPLSDPS